MINLELTQQQAVAVLLLIDREQELYAVGDTAPTRVELLREVLAQLDFALDNADTAPCSVES